MYRVKTKAVLLAIVTLGQYSGITCSSSTILCVLSLILKNQPTGNPSACGSLNITWNISVTTTINEIQEIARGKITCKWIQI